MARFDEIELQPAIFEFAEQEPAAPVPPPAFVPASRIRRILALLTDLSLFVALSLALTPLLPASRAWTTVAALAGFVVLVSFYYFAGCWLLHNSSAVRLPSVKRRCRKIRSLRKR